MISFGKTGLEAPDGSIVGIIEEGAGSTWPEEVLRYPLTQCDAVTRARTISRWLDSRRSGATLVMLSHDEALLEGCADEIWWLRDGQLVARGDPAAVLPLYRRHVAMALRQSGEGEKAPLMPSLRSGDGRAELASIELLGEAGQPSTVWRCGEKVAIRVTFRYNADVPDPVIGILIRTRIGLNVYGTNTQLEELHPGPLRAGENLQVTFGFECALCPGDYTVTAASHDPDGLWHDWQEDAVAFAVGDTRYTAGVANLRARVYAQVTGE